MARRKSQTAVIWLRISKLSEYLLTLVACWCIGLEKELLTWVQLNPRCPLSQCQVFRSLVHPTRLTLSKLMSGFLFSLKMGIWCANDEWYSLCTNLVVYICLAFEVQEHILFFPTTKGSMSAGMELQRG